jgi:hypothetical protein
MGKLRNRGARVTTVSKGVFAVNHPVRLFAGIILADGHSLLASVLDDSLCETLHIGVLDAKVKHTCFPVFKIVLRLLGILKLEQLDADSIAGGQVSDSKSAPAFPEHIIAHHANSGII